MLCILKAIVAWVILMIIGTNLIGFVMRGLVWVPPPMDAPTDDLQDVLTRESRRLSFANVATTIAAVVLTGAFLFALNHFWNIGLVIAAILLMASRLPDLLWEIRTGRKVSRRDMPKGGIYAVGTFLTWLPLPLIWYSLCRWPMQG